MANYDNDDEGYDGEDDDDDDDDDISIRGRVRNFLFTTLPDRF
jgi:hypothetical protein